MKTLSLKLRLFLGILLLSVLLFPAMLQAEGSWPKEIKTAKSDIIIYQPQPDSMKGDHLYARAAISFTTSKITTPVFGAIWSDSRFSTDRETGNCTIYDVKILNVRFPGVDTIDPAKVQRFKKILEEESVKWEMGFSLDELKSSLALSKVAVSKSNELKNDPPEIIFAKQNSVLIVFDGEPVYKEIPDAGLKRAINTPFLVLQDTKDNSYYLFGADYWYRSENPVKSPWKNIQKPPSNVLKYFDDLKKETDYSNTTAQKKETKPSGNKGAGAPDIIVRTRPSELIQSNGDPKFAPIQETQLLYVTNTDDNIFMTIDQNQYFVLISGRWYHAAALTGPWAFIESENIPPDFAKIPEGSEKDIVLASVAGTDASKDAVMDAQIPQTAAVDRKSAKCVVNYDGDPKFEMIKGTSLARAMNTSSTVLLFDQTYYVCDNAVWFVGPGPVGPWDVATSIPDEIQKIPPDDPSYNVKYVYIYDVQPDVVYIGYTPGYTGCYIYGPTVVYGTGFMYPPFYGPYYYPRPMTYGFCMNYNPWYGWSMGFTMSVGWCSFGFGGPVGYRGGWWGPPMYRPPYHPPYNHYYGPRAPVYRGGGNTVNINNNRTNIYNQRTDGSAKPTRNPSPSTQPAPRNKTGNNQAGGGNRSGTGTNPSTRDAGKANRATGQKNNVYTDSKGDVYRNNNGDWQKNTGKDWQPAQPKQQDRTPQPKQQDRTVQPKAQDRGSSFNRQEMDNQNSARQRGTQNMNNRNATQQRAAPARSMGSPSMGSGGRRK